MNLFQGTQGSFSSDSPCFLCITSLLKINLFTCNVLPVSTNAVSLESLSPQHHKSFHIPHSDSHHQMSGNSLLDHSPTFLLSPSYIVFSASLHWVRSYIWNKMLWIPPPFPYILGSSLFKGSVSINGVRSENVCLRNRVKAESRGQWGKQGNTRVMAREHSLIWELHIIQ